MGANSSIGRRTFLLGSTAVGGLMLSLWPLPDWIAAAFPNTDPAAGHEVNPWIVIHADDSVTIRVGQSELGQGVFTSNPMMVCEELQCDWSKVKAEFVDVNRHFRQGEVYGRLTTSAVSSAHFGRVPLQQAGASARERLKAVAAEDWNVPRDEVEAKNGVLTHRPTGRRLRYSEAAARAAAVVLDHEPEIKKPGQFSLIGTRVNRLDCEAKVHGRAIF